MPQVLDLGCWGSKTLVFGICDSASLTARSSLNYNNQDIDEPSHDIEVLIKLSSKESTIVCAGSPEPLLFIYAYTCNRRR